MFGGTVTSSVLSNVPLSRCENRVRNAAGQSLDVTIRRFATAGFVFHLADAVRLQGGGMVVDEELALAHLDAIAGQTDNARPKPARSPSGTPRHRRASACRRTPVRSPAG
jgi:hypothetical protein